MKVWEQKEKLELLKKVRGYSEDGFEALRREVAGRLAVAVRDIIGEWAAYLQDCREPDMQELRSAVCGFAEYRPRIDDIYRVEYMPSCGWGFSVGREDEIEESLIGWSHLNEAIERLSTEDQALLGLIEFHDAWIKPMLNWYSQAQARAAELEISNIATFSPYAK